MKSVGEEGTYPGACCDPQLSGAGTKCGGICGPGGA